MTAKILISPFSKKMRNDKENPKNYPYWNEVVEKLKSLGHHVTQLGITGEKLIGADEVVFNKSLEELTQMVLECDVWISVDNFFPHLCNLIGKPGIVLFGQSDPSIFGHPQNINVLKSREYVREKQFDIWEACEYRKDVFVEPTVVVEYVLRGLS